MPPSVEHVENIKRKLTLDATGAPPATLSSAQMAVSLTPTKFHDHVAREHKAAVGRAAPISGAAPLGGATVTDRVDDRHYRPPPDMRREDERLKTFDHRWPKDAFVKPADLARTGFYFLGRNDEVRCAFCKIEIGRFERGDDPAGEHLRWAPQCPLLRRRPTGNVPLDAGEPGRDECGPRAGRALAPAHPKYVSEAARLRSFANWPRSMRQTPERLADAGLFFTGEGDKTVCFHCDGGLKDWQEDDDPWEQHARWFQRCAYVQLMKGKDYVQRVMTELAGLVPSRPARDGDAAPVPVPLPSSAPTPPITSIHTPAPKPKRELPRLAVPSVQPTPAPSSPDDSKLCKICYEAELNVCFVPCGHVVACSKCALTSDKCPLCRRTYQSVLRLYYS